MDIEFVYQIAIFLYAPAIAGIIYAFGEAIVQQTYYKYFDNK